MIFLNNLHHEGIVFVFIHELAEAIMLPGEGTADIWFENYQVSRYESLQAELLKSETKFKAAFEASHDAIYISTVDGKNLDCNQNAIELVGFPAKAEFLTAKPVQHSPVKQPAGGRIIFGGAVH